jgi:NTE family protein
MLARNARSLRRVPPTARCRTLLPAGRGSLDRIGDWCRRSPASGSGRRTAASRIVDAGLQLRARVVFGAPRRAAASLAEAVMASCSIPGGTPGRHRGPPLHRRRRVVGHVGRLLAGLGLDEVYVLAPMVSFAVDHATAGLRPPGASLAVAGHQSGASARCQGAGRGTRVTVLGPGPEDLDVMGANLMAAPRRAKVLETALRTCTEALRHAEPDELAEAL